MATKRDGTDWYLVRTKPHKESWVKDQLRGTIPEVFLPLLRGRSRCFGEWRKTLRPLFPCYLFARFDLGEDYFAVRYMPGVHGLVCAGHEPVRVPERIIGEIQARGTDGIVEIPTAPLKRGQRVSVVEGPFRGLEAIFHQYLSGAERVAVLLGAVANTGIRVVLPTAHVA